LTASAEIQIPISVAATSSSTDSGSGSRERGGGGRESSSKLDPRSPGQLERVRSDQKVDIGEMLEKRAGKQIF
jgi:hypothetical protein